MDANTEIETYSGSSGYDEWFEHEPTRVGNHVFFQLLVLSILILQKERGRW